MTNAPRRLGLVALTLLATVLAGCGGAKSGADTGGTADVASLATGSAAPSASATAAAAAGRPQLRLDMNADEQQRLWNTYNYCLRDHGVKELKERSAGAPAGSGMISLDQSGEPKAAYVACADKLPLQPPELDKEKNPNYVIQRNDYVQCLRGRGMKIHLLPDGSGWTYDDVEDPTGGLVGAAYDKADKECTMEAFRGKK
ncbi:hypothetical protein ACLQ24_28320 [Micromonospora sp. DT4]|uniref:hypothetical protein n=1 Tax=Micromonospora sp. DT4 TaxID=3393438 RepID=UPI003CE7E78B